MKNDGKGREHVRIVCWRYDDTKDVWENVSDPRKRKSSFHGELEELFEPKDTVAMSWKLSNIFKP